MIGRSIILENVLCLYSQWLVWLELLTIRHKQQSKNIQIVGLKCGRLISFPGLAGRRFSQKLQNKVNVEQIYQNT